MQILREANLWEMTAIVLGVGITLVPLVPYALYGG